MSVNSGLWLQRKVQQGRQAHPRDPIERAHVQVLQLGSCFDS